VRTAATGAADRDQDIVELIRSGRRDSAFGELLRRYEGKVYRLCCAMLRDHAQAEDAAQDSLVRVWKALDRYDGRASLSSWIYAITRNRCLTALERKRTFASLDEPGEVPEEAMAALVTRPSDGSAQQLRDLVELLPERLRRVLLLYYYEGRAVGEVALMLGCPEGTVKTSLSRARATLAEMLKCRGLDDPAYWAEELS
jgi:RNA polymerase sigma-70 factor (ECF subfamily)